jgi:demethoxyubiquinone hydroxylase (CLK1/Coq7/Cat5 family)
MPAERVSDGATPAPEFSQADVQRLADLLRLPIAGEDLAEVTYRLGALLQELEKLIHLDLGSVEPIPVFPASAFGQPPRRPT